MRACWNNIGNQKNHLTPDKKNGVLVAGLRLFPAIGIIMGAAISVWGLIVDAWPVGAAGVGLIIVSGAAWVPLRRRETS